MSSLSCGTSVEAYELGHVPAYPVAPGRCPHCGSGRGAYWTAPRMIEAVRAFAVREGHPPQAKDWTKAGPNNPSLTGVIVMWGSWAQLLRAAGFEVGRGPRVYWTRERIVEAFRSWAEAQGIPPTQADWRRAGPGHPAWPTVRKVFGGWNAALRAAGFSARGSQGRLLDAPEMSRYVVAEPVREALIAYGADDQAVSELSGVHADVIYRLRAGLKSRVRSDYADALLCAIDRPHLFAGLEAA